MRELKSIVERFNNAVKQVNVIAEELMQQEEPEYKERPKFGQEYFYLNKFNIFYLACWEDSPADNLFWDSGNGFFTREAAEHEQACRVYKRKVREYNQGWEPDWSGKISNYEIRYDQAYKCFEAYFDYITLQSNIEYFKSRELAEKFIEQEIELLKKVFKIEGENEKI